MDEKKDQISPQPDLREPSMIPIMPEVMTPAQINERNKGYWYQQNPNDPKNHKDGEGFL